jgi:hypothetical protein
MTNSPDAGNHHRDADEHEQQRQHESKERIALTPVLVASLALRK